MLTGRESLVRLIGRRRRSPLPASLAALLSPSSPAPAQANVQGSGSAEAARDEAGSSSGGGAEWVPCPVCGESIRGSDYCVNAHLVDTVIVGRKFHENIELQEGARIIVERDPQNAKDHDAIKVLYAASEFEEMLGYLPRELAKILAPLFDKHYVECEGFVVRLLEQQLDSVPIQITIQKCETDDRSSDDLWENFIDAVKKGNFQRPNSARYQRNFNVMITDVMANHTHVFMAGYIDMLSCTDDPSEYDIKEILEVLSVPEMKEILKELPKAIRVAQVMDEALDDNNMEMVTRCIDLSENRLCTMSKIEIATSSQPLPLFFSRFSASWVYSKILTLGVSVYERDRRYTDAIRILKLLLRTVASDRRRGYWTLRLSVDLEHVGRPNESLSIAEGGVIDPWVRAGSKFALQRRVLRLSKPPRRWKVPSYADSVKRNIKESSWRLQYYADEGGGWQGTHSEGGVWMTIFGLLMWDVMFSDMEDVFQSKFQTAPLDLETDDFYKLRKDIIESQLKKIQDGMAEEMLISSWELHQGTSCRGVNWDRHSLADLRAIVACIGGNLLASLVRHLAVDYRSWSSGIPDLLLWRFLDERGGGEAKLVEVKGPRDQLSEQQRAWILVLMDFGFDVEVCKVSPVAKRR
ncbi:hypothetical protein PR202_gb17755 [Eleusine coracana subsp. coracana]|uniref:Fanconi-associated nuclease n=1 Tax=Eleusine coracana subsp. coracana TaxID=191504 RepID=A0AAV5F4F8_ELECO|nr:hypothetical protein PR202_gb17755 [Eleusine coracana subsp. coracana]